MIIRIEPVKKDHFEVAITGSNGTFNETLERSEIRHLIEKLDNTVSI